MRELSDVHFPEAEKIRVVMDNLSTHSPASLYNALPAPEARRILRRLEFHFTPKHASWLNMVEIERLRYAERSSVGGSCGPTGSTIAPAVKQVFLGISAVFGFG